MFTALWFCLGLAPFINDLNSHLGPLYYKVGDHPSWATQKITGQNWQRLHDEVIPERGIFWLRCDVTLPPSQESPTRLMLDISATASYEVWWDGHLIGRSGFVGGTKETEQPGPFDNEFLLPQHLLQSGSHQLAFRAAGFHKHDRNADMLFFFSLGRPPEVVRAVHFKGTHYLPFLGIACLMGLFYGMVYFVDDRRADTLWLAWLCLSVAALMAVESWRSLFGYAYPLHYPRLWLVLGLTALTCFLLIGFLSRRFFPDRVAQWQTIAIVALVIGYFGSTHFDERCQAMMLITLILAAFLAAWATYLSKNGARMTLMVSLGCTALLGWKGFQFMDRYLFIAFGLLLFGLMITQALELRRRRQARNQAQLMATSLEAQLLKKSIQPHFLLNTLTSLVEWLEASPQVGVKMIHALAEEWHGLGEVAGLSEIPLQQELALCRNHLKVMGYRQDCTFTLETKGLPLEQTIPPAIFHTLMENGVTYHGHHHNGLFRLIGEKHSWGQRFVLMTPSSQLEQPRPDGQGLRYVKMRLQERYPDRWRLQHGPEEDHWRTVIDLRNT